MSIILFIKHNKEVIFLSFLITYFYFFCIETRWQKLCQKSTYRSAAEINLPLWAKKMYDKNPNVGEVIDLYSENYKTNEFVKNEHTQYYKRWM